MADMMQQQQQQQQDEDGGAAAAEASMMAASAASAVAASRAAMAAEEQERRLLKPRLDAVGALKVLQSCFPECVDGRVESELNSYDDQNFLIVTTSQRFVLKVHNGVESRQLALLDAQSALFAHFAHKGIEAPREPFGLRRTSMGNAVRLLTWVRGSPLCDTVISNAVLSQSGGFLGQLRCCLAGFDHPGLHRAHAWDLRTCPSALSELASKLDCDPSRALAVKRALKAFETEVEPHAAQLRFATLHGDYNDANVVLPDDEGKWGILDLGDAIYSWAVCDPAIGLAYTLVTLATQGLSPSECVEGALCFLRGFASECTLEPAEVAVLLHLAACRLAMSFTYGWFSYRQSLANDPMMPKDRRDYLLFHALPASTALDILFNAMDDPDSSLQNHLRRCFEEEAAAKT